MAFFQAADCISHTPMLIFSLILIELSILTVTLFQSAIFITLISHSAASYWLRHELAEILPHSHASPEFYHAID